MKSKWLPTFPLHAANWLADPRVQMLKPAAKSQLLEALLRSWMLGKAIETDAKIAEVYAALWPEYEAVLHEHNALREKRSALGSAGNIKRWGSQERSQKGSPGDRTRVDRPPTPTITPTITTTSTTTLSPASQERRENWITPYCDAWHERTGGEMVVKHALKPLSKLRNLHGDAAVIAAWRRYLEQTEVQFCSVTQFASKYGQWAGTADPPRSREAEILRQLRDEGPVDDPFEAAWQSRGKALLS